MKLKIEEMPQDVVAAMESLPKPPSPEACMAYIRGRESAAVTPERLWSAMPRDVQRKISCHDLKRICDNLNSPNDRDHGRRTVDPQPDNG